MYDLYFGQGNISRSGMGKLGDRVLKGVHVLISVLMTNENVMAGAGLAMLDHELA